MVRVAGVARKGVVVAGRNHANAEARVIRVAGVAREDVVARRRQGDAAGVRVAYVSREGVVARRFQVDAEVLVRVAGVAREGVVAGFVQIDADFAVLTAGVTREGVVARRRQPDAVGALVITVPAAAVTLDGAGGSSTKVYSRHSFVGCSIDRETTAFAANGYTVSLHFKHMVACYASMNGGCSVAIFRSND